MARRKKTRVKACVKQQNIVLKTLNAALQLDPRAVEMALYRRVYCNERLADSPHVIAIDKPLGAAISGLGILNGVLEALNIPRVAIEVDDNGELGFASKFVDYRDTFFTSEIKPKPKAKKRRKR